MIKPRLLFLAPWYLFPSTTGGRIRTRDILRGMKGGRFEITLASPAPEDGNYDKSELESVCDRFAEWNSPKRSSLFPYSKMRHISNQLPISVITDWSKAGQYVVDAELERRPDLVVVDFVHTSVFMRHSARIPSVVFTHNVEAQIYERQLEYAKNPLARRIWRDQWAKMARFESNMLQRFNKVIAVSEKDRAIFEKKYKINNVSVIPTGVDTNYFTPEKNKETCFNVEDTLVFTGSMDWSPNCDALEYFMDDIWPLIIKEKPRARAVIVGRAPPTRLSEHAKRRQFAIEFTGFVEDVRPYIQSGSVFFVSLRIGGGTRLKVFEAMSMGCPVVSTSIGVEGLPLVPNEHYLRADSPTDFANAVITLLNDQSLAMRLAESARDYVNLNFSSRAVASLFEEICWGVTTEHCAEVVS